MFDWYFSLFLTAIQMCLLATGWGGAIDLVPKFFKAAAKECGK